MASDDSEMTYLFVGLYVKS